VNCESTLQQVTLRCSEDNRSTIQTWSLTGFGRTHHTALGDPTNTTGSPSHYAWCQITLALTHNFANLEKTKEKPYHCRNFPLHSPDYKYPLFYPIFNPRYVRHCWNEKCARRNTETASDFASRTLTHQETSQCTERDVDPQKNLLKKGFTRQSPSHFLSVNYADDQMNMSEHRLYLHNVFHLYTIITRI